MKNDITYACSEITRDYIKKENVMTEENSNINTDKQYKRKMGKCTKGCISEMLRPRKLTTTALISFPVNEIEIKYY